MIATAALPATPRQPLTVRSAQQLCWRQEWHRHRTLWTGGLAVWIFLFLIPGVTTSPGLVLTWSVLWTGVLSFTVAGYDLRHGIDPLVRGLALDGGQRWLMRLLMVILGSWIFHLAGSLAVDQFWAHRLWQPLANGPFSDAVRGEANTTRLEALAILALVAASNTLICARNHGSFWGIVYVSWLAGETGIAGWIETKVKAPGSYAMAPDTVSSWLIGLAGSLAAVHAFAGANLESRRAPITSVPASRRSMPYVMIGAMTVAILFELARNFLEKNRLEPMALLPIVVPLVPFGIWFQRENRKNWPSPIRRRDVARTAALAVAVFVFLLASAWSTASRNWMKPDAARMARDPQAVLVNAAVRLEGAGPELSPRLSPGQDVIFWSSPPAMRDHPIHLSTTFVPWRSPMSIPFPDGSGLEVNSAWETSSNERINAWKPRYDSWYSETDGLMWNLLGVPRPTNEVPPQVPLAAVLPRAAKWDVTSLPPTKSGIVDPAVLNPDRPAPWFRGSGMAAGWALLFCLLFRASRNWAGWIAAAYGGFLLTLIAADATRLKDLRKQAADVSLPAEYRRAAEFLGSRSHFQRPR